ncbi:YraN family protein [Nocardioides salsibiostraticola]
MTTQSTDSTAPSSAPTTAAARQALGAYGETIALRHLTAQGLLLLDRNWRCDQGEIDLVMREGRVLVICEVKTRTSNDYGTPHEAITDAKLDRLRRLGEAWQEARELRVPEVRVDLVAVLRPRRGPALVEHVRGIG